MLIDALQSSGLAEPYAVLDPDRSLWGKEVFGVPIIGGDEMLPELVKEGVSAFAVGVGSTGDNGPRKQLFELGLSHGLSPQTIRHPSAICSKWAETGAGSQFLPGAIVNAGVRLGRNVIVNSGPVVEHDCVIEDHVHVATGAHLASTVRVGAGAHVGAGATVRQSLTIGPWAVIGAGAAVVKDVASRAMVVGVPARDLRDRKMSSE